ncbi:MAG: glycosyltransferase family 2 protein [Gammaproteobacteria bacterium]|nr:glycosyltransferase family 2 protein [Gammaproteobacteria bacterium]
MIDRWAPKVTAVIVTYNSREHIGAALAALHPPHVAGDLDCVVVDNASEDGTADWVESAQPWVRVIRSEDNLGFGRGCNLGAEEARSPYLLFLNPDAELPSDDLAVMLQFLESRSAAAITGPAIVEGSAEAVQKAGLMLTPGRLVSNALGGRKMKPWGCPIVPGSDPFETDWVCGAAMLIRTAVFRQIGGFDPRFFLYFEETDLCRRVRDAEFEIWAIGQASARHVGGASAVKVNEARTRKYLVEHFYASRFYYLVKHFGWARAVGAEVVSRLLEEVRRFRDRLQGRASAENAGAKRPFLRFPSRQGKSS